MEIPINLDHLARAVLTRCYGPDGFDEAMVEKAVDEMVINLETQVERYSSVVH